jgi:hypothetical protein
VEVNSNIIVRRHRLAAHWRGVSEQMIESDRQKRVMVRKSPADRLGYRLPEREYLPDGPFSDAWNLPTGSVGCKYAIGLKRYTKPVLV